MVDDKLYHHFSLVFYQTSWEHRREVKGGLKLAQDTIWVHGKGFHVFESINPAIEGVSLSWDLKLSLIYNQLIVRQKVLSQYEPLMTLALVIFLEHSEFVAGPKDLLDLSLQVQPQYEV